MKFRLALLSIAARMLAANSAQAGGDWSHKTEFKWAKSSGIRIVEPNGFKVSVVCA